MGRATPSGQVEKILERSFFHELTFVLLSISLFFSSIMLFMNETIKRINLEINLALFFKRIFLALLSIISFYIRYFGMN